MRLLPLVMITCLLGACSSLASIDEAVAGDEALVHEVVEPRIGFERGANRAGSSDRAARIRELVSGPLTEDSAVRIALINNASLRAHYEKLAGVRADREQAGLLANPVIAGDAKLFSAGTELEFGAGWPLLDAFFRPLRVAAADAQLEAARHELARDMVGLVFDVRRAYATVRGRVHIVTLSGAVLAASVASDQLTQRLFDAGNVAPAARTSQSLTATRAHLQVAEAEAELQEAIEDLNILLGLFGPDISWEIAPEGRESGASPDLNDVATRAIAASLDVAMARAGANALAQEVGIANWEGIFPDVEIGSAALREPGGAFGIGPAGAITVPLFDQGQAHRYKALARLREQLEVYRSTALDVRSAARRFRSRLVALTDREEYQNRKHVPLANRLVDEVLANYNAMQIGAMDVLTVKQRAIDARREAAETGMARRLAQLDLEELLAGRLNPARLHPPTMPAASESPASKGGH